MHLPNLTAFKCLKLCQNSAICLGGLKLPQLVGGGLINYCSFQIMIPCHNLISNSQVVFCIDQQAFNNLITIGIRFYLEATNHIDLNYSDLLRSCGLYELYRYAACGEFRLIMACHGLKLIVYRTEKGIAVHMAYADCKGLRFDTGLHVNVALQPYLLCLSPQYQVSSKVVLLLSILLVICASCLSLSCYLFCSLQPCGHLRERADLLPLWYMMFSCVFVTFPYSILGQVWYLIVLIADLCLLPYFYNC